MSTIWLILSLICVIIGAFILGILVGRFHEGKLVVDGEVVGGGHHASNDGHH